jgi:hypothetical protein
MSETELSTTSSKVYIRNFDYTSYYEIDRVLPAVLDIHQNGDNRSAMPNAKWIEFCDKIDEGFKRTNILQCVIFFCDLMIGLITIFYMIMVWLIYIFPIQIVFIYFILGLAALDVVFHLYVQGPVNKAGLAKAKVICQEETAKLNLRAAHGSSIDVSFQYRKREMMKCEGYEFDSKRYQRYPEIYIEITVTEPVTTATAIDEYYGTRATDTENPPIATATEIRLEPYAAIKRTEARTEPYIPVPVASLYSGEDPPMNTVVTVVAEVEAETIP